MKTILPILIICIIFGPISLIGITRNISRSIPKLWLSIYIFIIVLLFVTMAVVGLYPEENHPLVNLSSLFFYVLILALPPCMYIYLRQLLGTNESSHSEGFIEHLYPAIALFIVNTTSFILIYSNQEDWEFLEMTSNTMTYANVISLLFIFLIQNVFYSYLAIKLFKIHKVNVDDIFSYPKSVRLQWVVLYIILYIIFIIFLYLFHTNIIPANNWTFGLFISLYLGFICWKGYNQKTYTELIDEAINETPPSTVNLENIIEQETIEEKTSYGDYLIDDEKRENIGAKLDSYMNNEKPFLDPKLTIYKLAKGVGTNIKYLRYVISYQSNLSFVKFVNSYRVEQAKDFLTSPEHSVYTIETIGEMSGFKSKSSFYTAFKEVTNTTPSEFKKRLSLFD